MHTIILPGWQHHKQHWQAVSTALSAMHIPHIVLDLPGFGVEPYQPSLDTVPALADWVVGQIKQNTSSEDVIIVGHSYGGRIAAYIAAHNPPFLKGLILVGSPNIYRPSVSTRIKKWCVGILRPLLTFIPENMRRKMRSADYERVRGTKLQKLFQNIIADDQKTLLPRIVVPTVLIWGEHDTEVPLSVAEEIKKLIPNSTLQTFTGAGHNIHMEKSTLLAQRIASYVQTF